MKGRRPTPEGSKARNYVQVDGEPPEAPNWLTADARAEWDRIIPALIATHVVSVLDSMALAAYCQSFAEWRACEQTVREEGRTYTTETGVPRMHPLARHALALLAELRRLGEQFGLTPIARQRIDAKPSSQEDNAFEDFAHGGGLDSHEIR